MKFCELMLLKYFWLFSLLLFSCRNHERPATTPVQTINPPPTHAPETSPSGDSTEQTQLVHPPSAAPHEMNSTTQMPAAPDVAPQQSKASTHTFTDIETLDKTIRLDIRYATTDNFTQSKIYDCARCWLRPEVAEALVQAHRQLQQKKLGLKLFDCYRPRPYQQRLWDKVPNADYVTPPSKGSMHSRGAAVDLTIVDEKGKELDMGTAYDFFGVQAHFDYQKLSPEVLSNRRLLRTTMESVGFQGIRTEWWHFSYHKKQYPLSDEVWPCQ